MRRCPREVEPLYPLREKCYDDEYSEHLECEYYRRECESELARIWEARNDEYDAIRSKNREYEREWYDDAIEEEKEYPLSLP